VLADRASPANTDSRLACGGNARRDSELIRGEAYFTIAHEKLRLLSEAARHSCARWARHSGCIHDDHSVECWSRKVVSRWADGARLRLRGTRS